jgi:hypothetical protein
MMLRLVCPALMLAMALAGAVTLTLAANDKTPARGRPYRQVSTMKIQMELEGKSITATLDDNATARDFVSLLPLTLTLRDYEATEKISDLPKKLSTESAPAGSDPSVGDLTYYAPWGNLAIFYKDFDYSKGLIKLGSIDSGVEALTGC